MSEQAPIATTMFGLLVRRGFYDDTKVSRVVPDYWVEMGGAQTNFATKDKWNTEGYEVKAPREPSESLRRGDVVLANNGRGENGTVWFVLAQDAPWLAGDFTKIGEVTGGMELVDQWVKVSVGLTGIPQQDIVLNSVQLEAE